MAASATRPKPPYQTFYLGHGFHRLRKIHVHVRIPHLGRVSLRDQHINRWHHEQREHRANDHSADQHDTDAVACSRARPFGQHQREVADYGRGGRHQDRPQSSTRRLNDRVQFFFAGFLKMVRKLHDQNPVLRHQSHQRDQAHLAVNIERRQSQERERQRSRDGQRHRSSQNDKRIPEALELSRQHQINEDARQQECSKELAAFHAQLPRFARIVDREALRQNLLRLVLEQSKPLVQRHSRWKHALNPNRIQLLELLQVTWLGRGAQIGKGGERHHLVLRSGYINLRQLLRSQTLHTFDLRNHLVTPPLNAEPVDVVTAQQRGKVLSSLTQVHTLRAKLVAIKDNLSLGLVIFQIRVGVNEDAARHCLLHQLVRELHQLLRLARRCDHEIHWEIAAAGQGWRSQRDHSNSRNL